MPPPATSSCRADRSRPVPADCIHPGECPSIKCLHPPHHHAGRTGRDLSLRIASTRVNTHHPNASARENHHHPQKKIPRRKPRDFFILNHLAIGQKHYSTSSPFHPYHLAFRLALVLDCFLFLQPKYIL